MKERRYKAFCSKHILQERNSKRQKKFFLKIRVQFTLHLCTQRLGVTKDKIMLFSICAKPNHLVQYTETLCLCSNSVVTLCLCSNSIQTLCLCSNSIQTLCLCSNSIQTLYLLSNSIQTLYLRSNSIQTLCSVSIVLSLPLDYTRG